MKKSKLRELAELHRIAELKRVEESTNNELIKLKNESQKKESKILSEAAKKKAAAELFPATFLKKAESTNLSRPPAIAYSNTLYQIGDEVVASFSHHFEEGGTLDDWKCQVKNYDEQSYKIANTSEYSTCEDSDSMEVTFTNNYQESTVKPDVAEADAKKYVEYLIFREYSLYIPVSVESTHLVSSTVDEHFIDTDLPYYWHDVTKIHNVLYPILIFRIAF